MGNGMKLQFNLTTSADDLNRFSDRAALLEAMQGFDGVELMQFEEDTRGLIPKERVIGLHMGYFPYWLDFWNGDMESVRREFGSYETAYRVYGGRDRRAIVERYRKELAVAAEWGVDYVVFHVSEATIEETFRLRYRHMDEEVIQGATEILNEVFEGAPASIALLMENLWQPGLTFTRPEMTARLMEGVMHPNKGIMLDTGHLLHTNLSLRTQEEGLQYIHAALDAHGDLCRHIRGIHLNQSLTGEYCERIMRDPPEMEKDYDKRCGQMFLHAFNVDLHKPFTCPGVDGLVRRIDPDYLTFEFITENRAQHCAYLNAQKEALGLATEP